MMIRRFVNVVAENYKSGMYSLHRLDVSKHLFYPSRDHALVMPLVAETHANTAAADMPPMVERLEELPAPCMKIHPPPSDIWLSSKLALFGLVSPRKSEGRILFIDRAGATVLCDADKQTTDAVPYLEDQVGPSPISVSIARADAQDKEEDLYVIHKAPEPGTDSSCFRVLRWESEVGSWQWERLPQPPFVKDSLYDRARFIYSFTVVDGGCTICMSSAVEGIGTYCFDTVQRKWRHAGYWDLPFEGRAEHVPDLKIWLGFHPSGYLSETPDLSNMATDEPPKLQHVWQDIVTPDNWSATRINLINLGSGRFCIAKLFDIGRHTGNMDIIDDCDVDDEVAVLTGIEIGRGGKEGLKVWKHRSILFRGMDYGVQWVL